jgi:poly-gamma-glutamate synthesis protein (capsule biosynthesis protein)
MEEDIKKLRPQVDVLVVSAHCGVHFVPMMIPMYQKEAAYAAIDAGADMVLMHHAHILKGIEVYKGKTIFYSLNNFADEHGLGFPGQPESPDFAVRGLGKFYRKYTYTKPAPDNEKRHGHPDAKKTIMVKAYIENGKIQKVTYSPAYILPDLEPEIVKRSDPRAKEVFEYIKTISEAEELKVGFSWEGDEVLISEGK